MKPWIAPLAASLALLMTGSAGAADDLVIGFATSLTGPYIANSLTNQIAVGIAADEINAAGGINGHKVRVVMFDTGGDPKQAVTALQQFANDNGAMAVIGPLASAEVRVAYPLGDRLGIVSITNAASVPGVTDGMKYGFRNTSDEGTQFRRLLEAMKEKKMPAKTASIIYATDEFVSKSLGETLYPTAFKAAGIPVTVSVGFPLNAFDVAPQVAQLKAHPADIVAIGGTTAAAVKVVREMRRQGITSRVVGSGTISDSDLGNKLGPDGEGLLYPTYFFPNLNPATVAFSKKFAAEAVKKNFNTVPNQNDASAYDIMYIYAEAMKRAKVTGDKSKLAAERTAIRDQILQMKSWNYKGLLGHSYIGDDNAAHLPTYVIIDNHTRLNLLTEIDD